MRQSRSHLLGSALFALCVSGAAAAADPLEFYVGGAIGEGEVSANVPNPNVLNALVPIPASSKFKEDHLAFKVLAGLRPIRLLSAELSYFDLGNHSGNLFNYPASGSMKGASGFAVLHLPIPVVDVFAKVGAARIQSTFSGFAPSGIPDLVCVAGIPCGTSPFQERRTSTTFAAGAGVQYKFAAWAVRAEYERFNVAGESPYLLSLGLTWSL
jgi:opacity protein-like surface antigen